MDATDARRRLAEARVGYLATADAGGVPHVVPFAFVLLGDTLYWAVDHKPKRSRDLKRLSNIVANPNVEVVVDAYDDDDWSRLWWVRAAGTASIVTNEAERTRALDALAGKYPQYVARKPDGPVTAIRLTRVTGWSAG
ncbi:MAG TPA: TIGR03668 family PPOX class F420-dependent oxidoreductase [Actinobacteria bacterium]|nr:TIGR03668 family PPOX class F420-dependent oxidoreductase [Actinomycetota bacterium]HCP62794.1 TIGR03668 family PPOX class F420-dependent oxidoreductase [Actinomycetota bacterium]